ncbi:Uncharacterized protein SCF082_LOCUS1171 [Durusdinium trenchii]|uniref:Uncharacterized protein n=1 Tax=Durusdinium trenchii TaxID=1381693 RepID=A0ABP0HDV8_9DINO
MGLAATRRPEWARSARSCEAKATRRQSPRDGEDPFHNEPSAGTQFCSENKLERATVILTGGAWWSSVYNMWIAQILLEEQMQVPVKIENVDGGNTQFWEYDETKLDELDGRVYSWDALHLASSGSMDCSFGFKKVYASAPSDLERKGCTENCVPCAHAMLEVWPHGQEAMYRQYVLENKTVEDGGRLGVVGEFGWWATASELESEPTLASFRGMRDAQATSVFAQPLTFGQYCKRTYSEWQHIASDFNPFALDASVMSHFCHHFFDYAILAEHNVAYSALDDVLYHELRSDMLEKCATFSNTTVGIQFYNLCKEYWIVPDDLKYALPVAETQLIRQGYVSHEFLYRGFFVPKEEMVDGGALQSTACANSSLMESSPGVETWTAWNEDTFGADGYTRFQNFDTDIVQTHNLSLRAHNMRSDVHKTLELSGRMLQEHPDEAAPILVSVERPSSLFQRHKYSLDHEAWGGRTGESFRLQPVLLPEVRGSSCAADRRPYADRCESAVSPLRQDVECGYEPQILYKAFASELKSYAPEAYEFLRRFQLTRDHQEEILATNDFDAWYRDLAPPTRSRQIVCDWVRNNTHVWESWLPFTATKTRCLGEVVSPSNPDLVTECSGHGSCQSSSDDLALHPNAGECNCVPGYTGDDCSGLVDPSAINVEVGDPAFIVFSALQLLTLAYIETYRRVVKSHAMSSTVFQTANPFFVRLLLYSCALATIGVSLWASPLTKIHCMGRPLFIGGPFLVAQVTVYVKLHRKEARMAMNTENITEVVIPFSAFLLGLFVVWFVLFPPTVQEVRIADEPWHMYESCEYGSRQAAFEGLLLVSSMGLVVNNVKVAFELRHKPTYFNEGGHLVRTCALVAVFAPVTYMFSNILISPDELSKYIFNCSSSLVIVWITLFSLLHPKLRIHWFEPERNTLKAGLYHPTGDKSLALGDPVADIPRQLESEKLRSRSLSAGRAADVPRRGGVGSWLRSLGGMGQQRRDPERRAPAGLRNLTRRFTRMLTLKGSAGQQSVVPVNDHHRVHLENIDALEKIQEFPSEQVEVTQDPVDRHDPSKRSLAYRSPEMYIQLEKRIKVVLRENAELTKIIEEHRIDPITGEMDEDFMEALQRIESEHAERTRRLEREYAAEIDGLQLDRQEERAMLIRDKEQAVEALRREKHEAVLSLKQEQSVQAHKLVQLEKEAKSMADTMRGTLPELSHFLASFQLEQYEQGLRERGLDSTELLILASVEDLRAAGLKVGHVRKLQNVLRSMQSTAPKVVMPAVAGPARVPVAPTDGNERELVEKGLEMEEERQQRLEEDPEDKMHPRAKLKGIRKKNKKRQGQRRNPGWISNRDPATGKTYLIHPLTGETEWDDSLVGAETALDGVEIHEAFSSDESDRELLEQLKEEPVQEASPDPGTLAGRLSRLSTIRTKSHRGQKKGNNDNRDQDER